MSLAALHRELDACRRCPRVVGPVIHGPPVASNIMLIGQAPGPHEFKVGRPFGWTAGKTLFRWLHEFVGVDEETFRQGVYIAAVARCFPGKAKGGGDRKPDDTEMANCRPWLEREVALLKPKLLIPVGSLAISQVLGREAPLVDFIGRTFHTTYLRAAVDVIALPHPSGASTWHRMEPGVTLLHKALRQLKKHPAMAALQVGNAARDP
jgi:uracil-DNA glycosylase